MKRSFLQIMAVCLSLSALFSCGGGEPVVIPRAKMSKIYAEMLVTDQWIISTPSVRQIADTSLVYEPILNKYGYTREDYNKSVGHYMDDPERFARIFRTTAEILDERIKELEIRKQEEDKAEMRRLQAEKFRPDIDPEELFPYVFKEPYVHYYDSLTFEPDSAAIYRLLHIETADTVYDRVKMIVKSDTVALADSIQLQVMKYEKYEK